MLLAIDVGNTNTVIGLCELPAGTLSPTDPARALESWRISTRRDRMPDEWFATLTSLLSSSRYDPVDIKGVVLASVVPVVSGWLIEMCQRRFGLHPVEVNHEVDLGIRILTDHPAEVGADRLANTVATKLRYGGPAIVVDIGTATTFDVVSADGDYLGGAIAPGPGVALEALTSRAARLSSVELKLPERAIGRNTITAVQSGTVLGYLALVEGMIARIRAELDPNARVITTGGLAGLFASASNLLQDYEPDLTLFGLRLIYARVAATAATPSSDVPHTSEGQPMSVRP